MSEIMRCWNESKNEKYEAYNNITFPRSRLREILRGCLILNFLFFRNISYKKKRQNKLKCYTSYSTLKVNCHTFMSLLKEVIYNIYKMTNTAKAKIRYITYKGMQQEIRVHTVSHKIYDFNNRQDCS